MVNVRWYRQWDRHHGPLRRRRTVYTSPSCLQPRPVSQRLRKTLISFQVFPDGRGDAPVSPLPHPLARTCTCTHANATVTIDIAARPLGVFILELNVFPPYPPTTTPHTPTTTSHPPPFIPPHTILPLLAGQFHPNVLLSAYALPPPHPTPTDPSRLPPTPPFLNVCIHAGRKSTLRAGDTHGSLRPR